MFLYIILFVISIFLIIYVLGTAIEIFNHWKRQQIIEDSVVVKPVERPAVGMMLIMEKSIIRKRSYKLNFKDDGQDVLEVYDLIGKNFDEGEVDENSHNSQMSENMSSESFIEFQRLKSVEYENGHNRNSTVTNGF